jgi:hypothetical protein
METNKRQRIVEYLIDQEEDDILQGYLKRSDNYSLLNFVKFTKLLKNKALHYNELCKILSFHLSDEDIDYQFNEKLSMD